MSKLVLGLVLVLAISTNYVKAQATTTGWKYDLPGLGTQNDQTFAKNYLEGCILNYLFPPTRALGYTVTQPVANEAINWVIKSRATPYVTPGANPGDAPTIDNNLKACFDMIPKVTARILSECSKVNAGAECEVINKIVAVKKCPTGFSRVSIDGTTDVACYQDCPAGFVSQGPTCVKPDTYVLNNFRNELECIANNNNKPCSIYHVRYFVPDCKESFYRLGSTVCIPRCPENFEDHETFCVRPSIQVPENQTVVYTYRLGAPDAAN